MPDPWSDLVDCLAFDHDGTATRSTARNRHLEYHRVVGGQLLAQIVAAAGLARNTKSPHGRGDLLTFDGTLVASYGQEALLRLPDAASAK